MSYARPIPLGVFVTFLVPILLYTFTINCVNTGAQKCLLSVCYALFLANNAYEGHPISSDNDPIKQNLFL